MKGQAEASVKPTPLSESDLDEIADLARSNTGEAFRGSLLAQRPPPPRPTAIATRPEARRSAVDTLRVARPIGGRRNATCVGGG